MCGYPMSHGVGCLIIMEGGHSFPQSVGAGCRPSGPLSIGAPGLLHGYIPRTMFHGFLSLPVKSTMDTATTDLTV